MPHGARPAREEGLFSLISPQNSCIQYRRRWVSSCRACLWPHRHSPLAVVWKHDMALQAAAALRAGAACRPVQCSRSRAAAGICSSLRLPPPLAPQRQRQQLTARQHIAAAGRGDDPLTSDVADILRKLESNGAGAVLAWGNTNVPALTASSPTHATRLPCLHTCSPADTGCLQARPGRRWRSCGHQLRRLQQQAMAAAWAMV